MTLRGLGLSVIFCFSSLLTAGAIFNYFPQKITYGLTSSMARSIVLGEVVAENVSKFSPEQKLFLIKKATDKLNLNKHK